MRFLLQRFNNFLDLISFLKLVLLPTFLQDINKELGGNAIHAVKTDVTQEQEVLALFKEIAEKYGKLDIVVNNAGMSTSDTLLEGEFAGWKSQVDVSGLKFTTVFSMIDLSLD